MRSTVSCRYLPYMPKPAHTACQLQHPSHPLPSPQVHKVNGVSVHNLAHLAQMVSACDDPFIRFDLEWNKVSGAGAGAERSGGGGRGHQEACMLHACSVTHCMGVGAIFIMSVTCSCLAFTV